MNSALKNYVQKNGTFTVDAQNNLKEEDFFRIYDLIESVGRFELQNLRKNNETQRRKLFKDSFITGSSNQSRSQYIGQIWDDINKEIESYKDVQDTVLKKVKINEQIWNSSMEQYLPPGEQYIKKALRFSLSSPFTFEGDYSSAQVVNMYKEASEFAIQLITEGTTAGEKATPESNFRTILVDNLGDDE